VLRLHIFGSARRRVALIGNVSTPKFSNWYATGLNRLKPLDDQLRRAAFLGTVAI
jgi:hypothetical protein